MKWIILQYVYKRSDDTVWTISSGRSLSEHRVPSSNASNTKFGLLDEMRLDKTLLIPREIQVVRSVVDELRETLCALCGGRLGGESCLWHFFPNGTWQTCSKQWAPAFFTGNFQFAQVATNLRDLHESLCCFWIDYRGIFIFLKQQQQQLVVFPETQVRSKHTHTCWKEGQDRQSRAVK